MNATTTMVPIAVAVDAAPHPIERLMRDRLGLLRDITAGRGVAAIARAMVLAIAVGGALFGASIGVYRGGIQIGFAAIKLPLVLLFTAALATPALTAFNLALDRPARLARDLALALCALGLGALVLAALAPLIFVARAVDAGYHQTTLLVVACCALAGLVALAVLVRGLRIAEGTGALTAAVLLCAVTAAVGAQVAWTLRPYLVRPRATSVPFVRDVEGSLLDAVGTTIRSVQGVYRRELAPLPGEAAPGRNPPIELRVEPPTVDELAPVDEAPVDEWRDDALPADKTSAPADDGRWRFDPSRSAQPDESVP